MLQRLRVNVTTMEAAKTMEDEDTAVTNKIIAVKKDEVHNTTGIGAEAVVVESTVIVHITVGHTECVPIRAKTAGTHHISTKRTQYGVTRCRLVREITPDRLVLYLFIK